MDGIRLYTVRLFIYATAIFACSALYGQVLRQPELQFTAPCASNSFNEFHVNFSWDPPLVNPDNKFILELSDKNGSFANAISLATYSDKNTIFKFEFVFGFPSNVYGQNYKVRVRSTNPQKISPESPAFPAYYLAVSDPLVINNFVGTIYSCDGSAVTIKVDNYPNQSAYRWYRNGTYLSSETQSSITTAQSGIYYVELDYGPTCSSATLSNAVEIVNGQSSSLSIIGESNREICRQQSYLLEASIDDPLLIYQWYKDGQPAWPQGYYPRIDLSAIDNAEGNWYVKAQRPGGCLQQSNTVNIQYRALSATLQSLSGTVLLPGDQIVLEVTTDASQPSYHWYKDGVLISNATQSSFTVTQPGTYYAKITETTADCTQEIETSTITITAPEGYNVHISKNADYVSCVSLNTRLFIDNIKAIMGDGSEIDIYNSAVANFSFQWYLNGQPINVATSTELLVEDASANGIYYVMVIYNGNNIKSNEESIQLGLPSDLAIIGESNLEICNQQSYFIEASIDDTTLIYQWFKDGLPVSEQGYYPRFDVNTVADAEGNWHVEIQRSEGCSAHSNTVNIQYKTINASLQSLSGTVLFPGDQIILEASSNAIQPTYVWFKNDVVINSEIEKRLTVLEPGIYHAKIIETAECELEIVTAKITIEAPTDLSITINASFNYVNCESTDTELFIDALMATLGNGSIIDIYDHSADKFSFQWYKDDQALDNETSSSLTLNDVSQNGSYYITAVSNEFNLKSNVINIQLGFGNDLTIISNGALSCDDSTNVLISSNYTDSGYDYQWYMDGQLMNVSNLPNIETNQSGTYKLSVSANGCTVYSNEVVVSPVNLESITIDAGENITISEGGSTTITASGGNSYMWYNSETMELLSNSQSITLTEPGQYVLVASINGCEVTKSFSVDYVESYAVPNVITPNADGFNDKWILPNAYANRDNVEVSIYTLNGEKIMQTNNYRNDWPQNNLQLKEGKKPLYIYSIIKDNTVLKKGTITVID